MVGRHNRSIVKQHGAQSESRFGELFRHRHRFRLPLHVQNQAGFGKTTFQIIACVITRPQNNNWLLIDILKCQRLFP